MQRPETVLLNQVAITHEPIIAPLENNPGAAGLQKTGVSFNDIDYVKTDDGSVSNVNAPKSIERLEEISQLRNQQRKNREWTTRSNFQWHYRRNKACRQCSWYDFGFSSIYIIFDEDVEFYWSRSRILEKLNSLPSDLVRPIAPAFAEL